MYRIGLTRKLHFFATSKSAYLWLVLIPLGLAYLYWHWNPLPSPFASGILVVITRESPTTYYLDAEGRPAGDRDDGGRSERGPRGGRDAQEPPEPTTGGKRNTRPW